MFIDFHYETEKNTQHRWHGDDFIKNEPLFMLQRSRFVYLRLKLIRDDGHLFFL